MRSFDGIPLQAPVHVEFDILPDPDGVLPPYDPVPSGDHFCTAPDPTCTDGLTCARSVSVMLGGCALSGCHYQSPTAQPFDSDAGAAEGMQLGTPALILATAVSQTAHETETGEAALTPEADDPRFGRAMPILAPTVPGDSYLIYKLLAHPGVILQNPFPPDPTSASAVAPEIVRLQDELVVGMPMPPSTVPLAMPRGGTNGNPGEMEWLSDWVLEGAPVMTCP